MRLHELEDELRAGKRVRRKGWDRVHAIVYDGGIRVCNSIGDYTAPLLTTLFADDWELVPDPCEEAFEEWWNTNREIPIPRDVWRSAWQACEKSAMPITEQSLNKLTDEELKAFKLMSGIGEQWPLTERETALRMGINTRAVQLIMASARRKLRKDFKVKKRKK